MKAFAVDRDVLRAAGPQATDFLQGQLSQDVAPLQRGDSAWSFLLQPQGKVDALLRVTRQDDDEWLLDVDGGYGEAVKGRLDRFKLRVRCDIEPLDWRCIALRDRDGGACSGLALPAPWPVHEGVDILGPEVQPPDDVEVGTTEEYERLRVEAGWPRMGAELTDRTIPAETGLVELTVSFTKGCYTGQELVARIDSRGGHVPRRLRGVVVVEKVLPPVGSEVTVDDERVGELTSVGEGFDRGTPVALAYVGRDVSPPVEASVRWQGGSARARVEELPLVS